MECGGLKPILPIPEGRSDAACRVVICLHAVPVYNRTPPTGTVWLAIRTQWHPRVGRRMMVGAVYPAMPPVGAGSSQREDSPAHRNIRIPCHPRTPGFYNDAARRVATLFEKWNCMIETDLRARRLPPKKRLNPYGPFAAGSLLEYGGLNPILPFLGGRSDSACHVVVK